MSRIGIALHVVFCEFQLLGDGKVVFVVESTRLLFASYRLKTLNKALPRLEVAVASCLALSWIFICFENLRIRPAVAILWLLR